MARHDPPPHVGATFIIQNVARHEPRGASLGEDDRDRQAPQDPDGRAHRHGGEL
jgi:hypothetical protein